MKLNLVIMCPVCNRQKVKNNINHSLCSKIQQAKMILKNNEKVLRPTTKRITNQNIDYLAHTF